MKALPLYDADPALHICSSVRDATAEGFTEVLAGLTITTRSASAHIDLSVWEGTFSRDLDTELEALDRIISHVTALRHELASVGEQYRAET